MKKQLAGFLLPLGFVAISSTFASAGSVTVIGANGANGVRGPAAGGAGGAGIATTATPSDSSNIATGTGGKGDNGAGGGVRCGSALVGGCISLPPVRGAWAVRRQGHWRPPSPRARPRPWRLRLAVQAAPAAVRYAQASLTPGRGRRRRRGFLDGDSDRHYRACVCCGDFHWRGGRRWRNWVWGSQRRGRWAERP